MHVRGVAVAVGLVGSLLAVPFSRSQGQGAAPAYANPKKAFAAWSESKTPDGRAAAIAWMEARAAASSPAELPEILSHLARAAAADRVPERFLAACASRGGPTADPAARLAVAQQLADWHASAGNPGEALSVLTAYLAAPELPPSSRDSTARKAAAILSAKLGRPAEAAELLVAHLAKVSGDTAATASLLDAKAALLGGPLADPAGAEADSRRVLAFGTACPAAPYAASAERLAALRSSAGHPEEAAEALALILRHPSLPPAGIGRKVAEAGATPAQLEECLRLLRARLAAPFDAPSDFRTRVDRVQPEVVAVLLGLGRTEDAVRECRVLAFGGSDRAYPQAIELAARCLKTHDGTLGRANALLEFHQPVTPPAGSANPLLAFAPLTDPDREAAALRLSGTPTDWSGWLNRSALLVWLDRPAESVDAARAAFASCPMSTGELQTCTAAVSRPVLVATRDTALGQRLVDYLLFGPAGPDGRAGSEDDIPDPFPEARQRILYPREPPPPAPR